MMTGKDQYLKNLQLYTCRFMNVKETLEHELEDSFPSNFFFFFPTSYIKKKAQNSANNK